MLIPRFYKLSAAKNTYATFFESEEVNQKSTLTNKRELLGFYSSLKLNKKSSVAKKDFLRFYFPFYSSLKRNQKSSVTTEINVNSF